MFQRLSKALIQDQSQDHESSAANMSQSNAKDQKPFEFTLNVSPGPFKSALLKQSKPYNDQPICHNNYQKPSEEAKITSNKNQSIEKIIWEWQSNPDPWSSEPKQWTPYDPTVNDLLEKAYQDKEKEVILDQWIVYVSEKHMFQQRRDNPSQQRRVRRMKINMNGDMKEEIIEGQHPRMQRFIEGETPKTYTNAFGSLDDYMSFFENRTPEMASFVENFKKIESTQDLHILNHDIVPVVIESIRTEAVKLKTKSDQKILIKLFETSFTSFEQFYGTILNAYTMETFLYKNLNQHLRNEDWTQLDDLLPYAFLVCKAFECSELTSTCNKYLQLSDENQKDQLETLTLYRGAQFDETSLSFYNPNVISIFSWNAVTSTSTNPCVAEFFSEVYEVSGKIPVIFVIEASISKNLNLIDIKTLSVIPDESEVVLPPGSIFKLISFTRDQKRAEIKLRLINDTSELAVQGKIMPGAMHTQVSKGTVARIICQEGKELVDALKHLKGNRMVEKLDCTLCKHDKETAALLADILLTLPKLNKITLASLTFDQDIHLKTILKAIGKSKIRDIEVSDRLLGCASRVTLFMEVVSDMKWLLSLELDFRKSRRVDDEQLKKIVHGGMNHLTSLTNLAINFKECEEITDQGMKCLCSEGLKYLTSLTTLSLNLGFCEEITDEGIESLSSEGLKHLRLLTSLSLNLGFCEEITDEGMKSLSSKGLRHLRLLTILRLDLSGCKKITDEGVTSLSSEGLRYLPLLTILRLDLSDCEEITDEGVRSLSSEGLRHLTLLITLDLSFEWCDEITDEGMKVLCSDNLMRLTSLKTLALKFLACGKVTDEGMKSLSSGLQYLTSLTNLTLDVQYSSKITDEGLDYLRVQADTLKISLFVIKDITSRDKGVFNLRRNLNFKGFADPKNQTESQIQSLEYFDSLDSTAKTSHFYSDYHDKEKLQLVKNLELNYNVLQDRVFPDAMKRLCSERLRHMISLKTLTLNFEKCQELTGEEIRVLASEGLRCMTSLTTLSLDFKWCTKIADEEVKMLCSKGLRYLTSLRNLTLDFYGCNKITDEGVRSLSSVGLRYLTSLTALTLNFGQFDKITDKGVKNLGSEGLVHLTSLATLILNFHDCNRITDKGVKSLCSEGLRHLTLLTTLTLIFNHCEIITDEGVKSLSLDGLKYLHLLRNLTLHFAGCKDITDEGVQSLCFDGLRFLNFLTRLDLDFVNVSFSETSFRELEMFLKYFRFSSIE